mgnify:CR=1 FL=1
MTWETVETTATVDVRQERRAFAIPDDFDISKTREERLRKTDLALLLQDPHMAALAAPNRV